MTKEYFSLKVKKEGDKRKEISENVKLIDSSSENDWIRKTDVNPDYMKTLLSKVKKKALWIQDLSSLKV